MFPVEMVGIPSRLDRISACVPFPAPGAPSRISLMSSLLLFLKEAGVVAHQHLRLDGCDGLQSNADHDDDGRAAKGESRVAHDRAEKNRQDRDDAEIDRAEEGNLVDDLADEVSGRTARTEAGNEAAVLLQVVGHLNRVVLNGRIEVAEAHDQDQIDDRIDHTGAREHMLVSPVARPAAECADRGGQARDGLCEDDRHNAGHVDLDGQVRVLATIDLTADNALGVLDRDAALSLGNENDEDNDRKHGDDQQQRPVPEAAEVGLQVVEDRRDDAGRDAGDDVGEQDHRDAVAEPK